MGSTASDSSDLRDSDVLVGELERVADSLDGQVDELPLTPLYIESQKRTHIFLISPHLTSSTLLSVAFPLTQDLDNMLNVRGCFESKACELKA